nr:phosphatase PAP2 family protein [Haloarcula hispanica]
MLVALLAVAVALVVSLKGVFALPRPPGAGTATHAELLPAALRGVYESMATGEGFGFPSGHATLSLLVWGGIAWALRVGTRRQRAAVAATIIALIGLSRLVLGVHYVRA